MRRLTVISRRARLDFANTRNMVAKSAPLAASAYPPEGFNWDVKSNSSPVVSLSTVRALLFRAGLISDVISSVDVSVAFLQADPYPDTHPNYIKDM